MALGLLHPVRHTSLQKRCTALSEYWGRLVENFSGRADFYQIDKEGHIPTKSTCGAFQQASATKKTGDLSPVSKS